MLYENPVQTCANTTGWHRDCKINSQLNTNLRYGKS